VTPDEKIEEVSPEAVALQRRESTAHFLQQVI
jgi:hypothetical protein